MALTNSYLITTKNLEKFLKTIQTAQAPKQFIIKFLDDLGFTSSNDRLFIGLLKALGFLDVNGVPTERYYQYLDQSISNNILAAGIKEAYDDLFKVNIMAYEMEVKEVKNKIKTLTKGEKSDKVVSFMANTFRALCDLVDWSNIDKFEKGKVIEGGEEIQKPMTDLKKIATTELHYNIQIHLPESRDSSVYDAIFQSLKKHLF